MSLFLMKWDEVGNWYGDIAIILQTKGLGLYTTVPYRVGSLARVQVIEHGISSTNQCALFLIFVLSGSANG